MKVRLKNRRIAGKDPVTFTCRGVHVHLADIGSESHELDAGLAHELVGKYSDILELVHSETKMAKTYENKAVEAKSVKRSTAKLEEEPLQPSIQE